MMIFKQPNMLNVDQRKFGTDRKKLRNTKVSFD